MQIFSLSSSKQRKPTSQYLGVNWDKQYGKWKASIRVNDKKKRTNRCARRMKLSLLVAQGLDGIEPRSAARGI